MFYIYNYELVATQYKLLGNVIKRAWGKLYNIS